MLLPAGGAGDAVRDALTAAVTALSAGPMLSERIATAYRVGSGALTSLEGVRALARGVPPESGTGWWGVPLLLEAEPAALEGALGEECFGPVLAVMRYADADELARLLDRLSPALTATVHADPPDREIVGPVLERLSAKVGRVVWNGYPTGVAVAWAMQHGGPYPASTDPLHTSVGAAAIRRFLRPVCYQDVPEQFLPPELVDVPAAEHAVPRRVDGRLDLPA